MSVNKYQPHIMVLPEDDANRQLANGFFLDPSFSNRGTSFQVLPEAGGWVNVLESFKADEARDMERYPQRFMILLIDFDGDTDRIEKAKKEIPGHLLERVFILGALQTPEVLRRAGLGDYETIGLSLAKDCREERYNIWGHDLLRHNENEIKRLITHVRPILFNSVS